MTPRDSSRISILLRTIALLEENIRLREAQYARLLAKKDNEIQILKEKNTDFTTGLTSFPDAVGFGTTMTDLFLKVDSRVVGPNGRNGTVLKKYTNGLTIVKFVDDNSLDIVHVKHLSMFDSGGFVSPPVPFTPKEKAESLQRQREKEEFDQKCAEKEKWREQQIELADRTGESWRLSGLCTHSGPCSDGGRYTSGCLF